MYKIIIADDERGSREILQQYVRSSQMELEVVGLFANGESAMEYISNNPVDVLLADIRMPGLSGLDLARMVSEQYPSCRVVLISGYSEFDYARRAIQYGVINYLVKPIDVCEFYDTLAHVKQLLAEDMHHRQQDEQQLLERRTQFFTDLLTGSLSEPVEIEQAFSALEFSFEASAADLSLFRLPGSSAPVLDAVRTMPGMLWCCTCSDDSANLFLVLLTLRGTAPNPAAVHDRTGVSCTQLFFGRIADCPRPVIRRTLQEQMAQALSCLLAGDRAGADEILRGIPDDQPLQRRLQEVYALFCKVYQIAPVARPDDNASTVLQRMAQVVAAPHSSEHTPAASSENAPIVRVREYIAAHYRERITRNDAAEYVFLSPSYFSRYFKQKTGLNFNEYLTIFRMRKAIELLDSRLKISSICEQVGYSDIKRFRSQFKQYTTYTPAEYRARVLRHEAEAEAENEE